MRGYILAGGASVRMGRDKARVCYPGTVPMAAVVAEVLRAAGLEPVIVRQVVDEPFCGTDGVVFATVGDGGGSRHPLRGVAAALAFGERCLVVPCDLVGITVSGVNALLAHKEAVATDGEHVQPLFAVLSPVRYRRADQLIRENGSALALVEGVQRVQLPASELRNINRLPDSP